jgi:hypothetical protein
MRIPLGSPAEKITRAWAERLGVKFLGVVRYSPSYSTLVDKGSSVFDDKATDMVSLRNDWKPLLDWLGESYFGSSFKRDGLRETHKIVDEWPRAAPNLKSFTVTSMPFQVPVALASAVVAVPRDTIQVPAASGELAQVEVAAPDELAPSPSPSFQAPHQFGSYNFSAVGLASGEPTEPELGVAPGAELDELAPDELVVLVVDGELDLGPASSPPKGLFASMNKGLRRFWGAS